MAQSAGKPSISYQQMARARGFDTEKAMLEAKLQYHGSINRVSKDLEIPYANVHKRLVDFGLIKVTPRIKK